LFLRVIFLDESVYFQEAFFQFGSGFALGQIVGEFLQVADPKALVPPVDVPSDLRNRADKKPDVRFRPAAHCLRPTRAFNSLPGLKKGSFLALTLMGIIRMFSVNSLFTAEMGGLYIGHAEYDKPSRYSQLYGGFELFPGFECYSVMGFDFDGFAGSRIAGLAGFAADFLERAKPDQRYAAVFLFERVGNAVHERTQRCFSGGLGYVRVFCHLLDQFGFCHFFLLRFGL